MVENMIMRDFRYVIKKILIGFGILVLFSLFKSCNVYALDYKYDGLSLIDQQTFNTQPSHNDGDTYEINACGSSYIIKYYIENNLKKISINDRELVTYVNNNNVFNIDLVYGCWENTNQFVVYYAYNTSNATFYRYYGMLLNDTLNDYPIKINGLFLEPGTYSGTVKRVRTIFVNGEYDSYNDVQVSNGQLLYGYNFDLYGSTANFRFKYNNTYKSGYYKFDYVDILPSEIINLHYTPVTEDDDFGTLFIKAEFRPEFSNFDLEHYNYYYFVDDSPHLSIIQNQQLITIAGNSDLYIVISDKNNNVVDSETVSISDIGEYLSFNDNFIKYVYVLSTNDNSDEQNKRYTSEGVSQVFGIFDLDKYEYYYKFVPKNSNEEDFQYLSIEENYFSKNFTSNGRIYTKVVKKNTDTILVSSTFDITEIGNESSLITESLSGGSAGKLFNTLNNVIDFGGPISQIVLIPSQFISKIIVSSNQVCRPISLGSFRGKNLSLPCIDIESHIGSNLWNTIDLLMVVSMIIGISIYFRNLYTDLVNLDYKPKHVYSPKHASDEGGGMV